MERKRQERVLGRPFGSDAGCTRGRCSKRRYTPSLTATSGREAVDEAVAAANALQGTPQQKAALLDDLLTQAENSIDGFIVSGRQRVTDGSYIFVGQYGEARVVNPTTGQIYRGNSTQQVAVFNSAPTDQHPITLI
jgi:hypothetical protein